MKLCSITKLGNIYTATLNKFDDDMSANYDIIVIFPNYVGFRAIRKPVPGRIIYNSYFIISKTFYLTKIEIIKKGNTALILLLCVKLLFSPKNADICKTKRFLVL